MTAIYSTFKNCSKKIGSPCLFSPCVPVILSFFPLSVRIQFRTFTVLLVFNSFTFGWSVLLFINRSFYISEDCFEYLSGDLSYSITFHVLRDLGVIRYQVY